GISAYYGVDSTDLDSFTRNAKHIAEAFVHLIKQAQQGRIAPPPVATNAAQPASDTTALASKMGHAALIEWIGKETEAKAPRDITAWVVDKDLLEPSIQSMDVRLLVNKNQLDSLKTVLGEVISAGRRGQIGGEDFFTALQATAATASRSPDQIKNARSMAEAGFVPEFLVGLPYKSKLMAMSNELWASWSNDDQDEFLSELDAKVQLYTVIHDTADGWVQLNAGDDANESVYPISLDVLP
ncbi:MAG: VWA domain-containing protein, partial [Candidatus Tectomicrobia bacterium]|nr:VWA domain-containing protein [Candidatus Tectomicrobia bacterium]